VDAVAVGGIPPLLGSPPPRRPPITFHQRRRTGGASALVSNLHQLGGRDQAQRRQKGFVVLPRRWVVERTFSWFGRNRSLAKDFENLAETLVSFVTLASIQLAIRRLARA
jgi:transposase